MKFNSKSMMLLVAIVAAAMVHGAVASTSDSYSFSLSDGFFALTVTDAETLAIDDNFDGASGEALAGAIAANGAGDYAISISAADAFGFDGFVGSDAFAFADAYDFGLAFSFADADGISIGRK
mmetsp:Transcript_9195/g.23602  ORF Transcript_9195/g.23602 Transcript_9195/m.23602 type:complete len:123 (+) Transcript_9195:446-814(+)|eukprot:CAMPEP_0198235836 /NCGR_PEP_ID=MMETSP1446-20131203/1723_1 /TAXON_ID=1461542 ORGANISM="Unidentified sp, Strain CCMP2111" /NCGR_SAMPLE_ID=MMETSP1446 /ASSEMBLY_ACC=CAM_ASM_001112 /LENGTH=122 /DNA_ID=CAMNT_0043917225 /DNA_START=424 /DNA_END=792 /DNA_ORIENTATION=-